MAPKPPRGSRKHILDWLDSGRLPTALNGLLGAQGIRIGGRDVFQPRGSVDPQEWTLRRFCRAHCVRRFDFAAFDSWWVSDQYRNPQWDWLSTCTIDGASGLLMIEAKANALELKLRDMQTHRPSSKQSRINNQRIRECIDEAAADLRQRIDGIGISYDSHYQLSNRVASAWKLAQCGLTVALVYLGFTGDGGITDVGPQINDGEHWQQLMTAYASKVLPTTFPGMAVGFPNGASMRMLIRSLPVIQPSPPPSGANRGRAVDGRIKPESGR